MKTIVVATGNKNKAIELKEMLDCAYEVKTMGEMGIDVDIVEDGLTFEENALIKVRAIAPYIKDDQVIIMADDSGLCVDALDGRPGIYSARYAGDHVSYHDNNVKLLKEMAQVPDERRGAQFVCAVALLIIIAGGRMAFGVVGHLLYEQKGQAMVKGGGLRLRSSLYGGR